MYKKYIYVIFISLCIVFLVGCGRQQTDKNNSLSVSCSSFQIEPSKLLYFENMGIENFTCTGFTYDSANDSYWIGDHGSEFGDPVRLVQINSDMNSVISCVQIENYCNDEVFNLQGVAYDYIDDMLWCAVGDSIVEVTKEGIITKSFSNNYFVRYKANGISIDPTDSSLWVLCYEKKLIHITREGDIIDDFEMNYRDQDMIFVNDSKIYITIGADYTGENNFLAVFDKKTNLLIFDYQLSKSYAIEGVCIKEGYLYIVNDGLYHKCSIPKSYVSVYKLD